MTVFVVVTEVRTWYTLVFAVTLETVKLCTRTARCTQAYRLEHTPASHTHTHTHTHTIERPLVRDYPGEPVPET